jgi:hypothetical protein
MKCIANPHRQGGNNLNVADLKARQGGSKKIGRSMRVFGVRPYQPSARRVYQPAALR